MYRILLALILVNQAAYAQDTLSYYKDVYQIQVVEKDSDYKTSIGSGFQVDEKGHIATNYHVVSSFVDRPKKYRLKLLTPDGQQESLSLINFDIINDVALLKRASKKKRHLKISDTPSQRGDRLFALGNPYDVGVTLVRGIYNGLQEYSIIDRFVFSGSLNPGMSGGPALNQAGKVVGINVSRADSQLSFLVPIKHLSALLKAQGITNKDFAKAQQDQILNFQKKRYQKMLQKKWSKKVSGNSHIPGKINQYITCWVKLHEKKKQWPISSTTHNCISKDSIYLKDRFTTGQFLYSFDISKPEDGLSPYQLSQITNNVRMRPDNKAGEKDIENWRCQEDYLKLQHIESRQNKIVLCARQYKSFPKLYDTLMTLVVHGKAINLTGHLSMAGVTQDIARQMLAKFLSSIQWNK